MIRAFVGAGGKTTCIKKYAQAYRNQGKKVFVTTSTHMYIEKDTLLTDDAETIIQELERHHYVMAGIKEGEKIRALSPGTYEKVCQHADEVLVEADGSKHFPLKYPNEKEPVIYENVDEIVIVCGMHALRKTAKEVIHRFELANKYLGITADTRIEPLHIQKLIKKGYVEPLREKYPEKNIIIEHNGSQSLYQRAVAGLLQAEMDVSMIQEEWFRTQPQLVICGGGHISCDLVKMASCLDFRVKVMDDRGEFANPERFPQAEEVICDSFENLEKYLEADAYYVVVTRGHKDDYICVKKILASPYQYLGMIGSKVKVKKTFELLRQDGISEEQIETIHAPIGLDIKAITPAEIAVSILAQIIQEKNCKHSAFASKELLGVQERGVLCIIIEKSGSSPRGVGSMMFVNEQMVIDSIGGGAVEFAAIEEARKNPRAMVKEYHLNTEKSRELGMICGGSNKVLFIPV